MLITIADRLLSSSINYGKPEEFLSSNNGDDKIQVKAATKKFGSRDI